MTKKDTKPLPNAMDVLVKLAEASNGKSVELDNTAPATTEEIITLLKAYYEYADMFQLTGCKFTYNDYYNLLILFNDIMVAGSKDITLLSKILDGDLDGLALDEVGAKKIASYFSVNTITTTEFSDLITLWCLATTTMHRLTGNVRVVKGGHVSKDRKMLVSEKELEKYRDKYTTEFFCPSFPFSDLELLLLKIKKLCLDNGDSMLRLSERDFVLTIYNYCKLRTI